ncbi:MAG: phosphopyruvate hydratase [Thermoprotei archaeon]|nr:MAG: phosphopyruvate hydratase [Thermoprotei archaeon]
MEFDIAVVRGLQVIDSRGDPTIEAYVLTEGGGVGRAIAPSGASRGKLESIDLRDGGKAYKGKGVMRALEAIEKYIAPAITGMDSSNYRSVDKKLIEIDGTPNKSKLGGNTCTAVSLAVINAAADTAGVPTFEFLGGKRARTLPTPLMNIINGGVHAGNKLSIQEFMIAPVGASTFSEALRIGIEVYKELRNILKNLFGPSAVNVGDEGGYAPPMTRSEQALNAIVRAIKEAGYEPGTDVFLALDAAATQFFNPGTGKYVIDGASMSPEDLLDYYVAIANQYPVKSFEDPFHEEQIALFKELRRALKGKALVVGDDLTVTRLSLIRRAVKEGAVDGSIIKINQVGTFSEAEDSIRFLISNGGKAIISHRSGDSEDVTISHIAVAYEVGLIKCGAPSRGERTSKYNELLRIEDILGGEGVFAGKNSFS